MRAMAYTQVGIKTRWRSDDLAESSRAWRPMSDWTKVHVTNTATTKTLCGLHVPEYPYLQDINDQIPTDAPMCKRCERMAS